MFDLLPPPQDVSAPTWDLTVGLINATVQIDQPNDDRTRRVGTGFLIDAPRPDGQPRTVLVTAAQVLAALTPQTVLVSLMWVSNELGTVNEIETLAPLLREGLGLLAGVWWDIGEGRVPGKR